MQAVQRLFRGSDEEIAWEEPICLQCQRDGTFSCKHCAPQYVIVERDRVVTRFFGGFPFLPTQLPLLEGSWSWIRHANYDIHRATRLDAHQLLLTAFDKGGYAMLAGGRRQCVNFRHLQKMRDQTLIISHRTGLPELPQQPVGVRTMMDHFPRSTPPDKAVELARQSYRVALVSAASGYCPGGGSTKGGRHALEEALCLQSTLFDSLREVQDKLVKEGKPYQIPEDGVILSPLVEFFRGGSDQGYPLYGGRETLELASVVSMAMYNRNPQVRDSPLDAPLKPEDYELGVEKKFSAALHAAVLSGADSLVLPDVGCGVFQNDPQLVGKVAGRALQKYIGYFRCIVCTGTQAFYEAARSELARVELGNRPQEPAAVVSSSSTCVVCQKLLGRDLAVVLGPHGERKGMFMHEACCDFLAEEYPGHTAMTLPRAAASPEAFLKALDVDGNGVISKEELRSVVMALGCVDELQFERRWKEWDQDGSGTLSLRELQALPQKSAVEVISTSHLPRSLLDWVSQQAAEGMSEVTRMADSSKSRWR
mmetsp:Transcript_11088/g.24439  ORF Transcript_11088/g.24439 Transcript_11088/m.24439 type:complete len:537 (-) Transcript_11088:146-1756(-)|eukprot:CAMPEP_0206437184 /NCGR_PEP_ID=MMETSP0324_2-20121206/10898_1 /ASSEMBLY_ACC=CAM_ASM_000836 /TAXON_ID=2866 /ORGANISM="Crypthecodinium cohnii, Strain Seligo" /LENGTH=536 /DNA_ID=CAMNT_0053904433 /DNA_START=61 /DNA_END=1671 /DNA_ORIENTATION=+